MPWLGRASFVEQSHGFARAVGSIIDSLHAPDDVEAVIERMAKSSISMVSLTTTDRGYNLHTASGKCLVSNPRMRVEGSLVPASLGVDDRHPVIGGRFLHGVPQASSTHGRQPTR